jgi:hypothetical protein
MDHIVHAIADPQNGNSQIKKRFINTRAVVFVYAGRTAGKDDALGMKASDFGNTDIRRFHLAIDVMFTDPSCNKLVELRAEINNNNHEIIPV